MNPAVLSKIDATYHATREGAIESFARRFRDPLIGVLTRRFAAQLGRDAVIEAVDDATADACAEWRSDLREGGAPIHSDRKIYAFVALRARSRLLNAVQRHGFDAAPVYGVSADVVEAVLDRHTPTPEEAWIEREAASQVREAVAELDDQTLAVLELRHVEKFKRPQIAQQLALTERQVKRRLMHGNELLYERYREVEAGATCDAGKASVLRAAFDLASGSEARRARAHMGHCAHCRQRYARAQAFRRSVAGVVPLPLVGRAPAGGLLGHLHGLVSRLLGRGGDAQRTAVAGHGATAKIAAVCLAGVAAAGIYAVRERPQRHRAPAPKSAAAIAPTTPVALPTSSPSLEHTQLVQAAARQSAATQRRRERARRRRAAAARKRGAATKAPIQATDEFFSPSATPTGARTTSTTSAPVDPAPTQTTTSSSPTDEFAAP